jgi:hypothetical protein
MFIVKTISFAVAVAATLALSAGQADAHRMNLWNARHGCETLVKQAHSDLKYKERVAEIKKCKADPDAYNKAAGF